MPSILKPRTTQVTTNTDSTLAPAGLVRRTGLPPFTIHPPCTHPPSNDHLVVLVYTDKTLFLVQELITLLTDEGSRKQEGPFWKFWSSWFKQRPTIVVGP